MQKSNWLHLYIKLNKPDQKCKFECYNHRQYNLGLPDELQTT